MKEQVTAPAGHTGGLPWVRIRSASSGPHLYKRMLGAVDPKARPGDLVAVYDKTDAPYGVAIYNPKSLISLRLLSRGKADFDADSFFADRLGAAVALRRQVLELDKTTDAYRLVHDNGDGLGGLVVDRYGDFIVLEFYSLGMFRQADRIEGILKGFFPNARFVRRASEHTQSMEGFRLGAQAPARARIRENGVLFEADLAGGHKTGFFCDQRDNRLAAAAWAKGKKVLDICGFTGGFALYAKIVGGAEEVTTVELDPESSELARKNSNINNARIKTVCADAFPYMRQAVANKQTYGLIIVDPYKLIANREGWALGRQKYIDFNKLALALLEPGGLLITCSCSGMLPWDEFQAIVRTAAGASGRRFQILRKSGAGADHPVAADHPEGEYLKVIWGRAP